MTGWGASSAEVPLVKDGKAVAVVISLRRCVWPADPAANLGAQDCSEAHRQPHLPYSPPLPADGSIQKNLTKTTKPSVMI